MSAELTVERGSAMLTDEGTSRFVQTATHRVHYNEAGSGHPVILLHGSGPGSTGWSNFRANIAYLAESFHVYAVDMPGWGRSDTQTPETGYDHVAALVAFMDELGIEKAALVGNSMGGITSISTAILHPGRVSHLVSMGAPVPGQNTWAANGLSEGLKILFRTYLEPTIENMRQVTEIMTFDSSSVGDDLAALRLDAALAHPEHLASWNEAPGGTPLSTEYFTYGPRLAEITAPTLAIHGRDDRVVSYEQSLRLVSAVDDSRLLLINQCGHWAQIEHADEFNRVVGEFIRNN
ncbi:2-hydroxy-6-oxonona-2,4-dienedioate hydrolase [Prauserella marina]|uniref:2-hydroxy-6-oxonona-2,4-dienedioate hydrolase n=1 Tax=Prauserella marina TaxID=530584 RepID=A0A1G6Y377_9PSEU|nr:alpha/beta hydrolase [Prauserella marina]PWV80030.1 2-hydroxy-6-oxonona-2,4-dienedioate hydrolase [Prauserella marina]SDD84731.1 2-hydroxy-6-oxonona-2,4-dienedioate hydrolase [Prauserella marina]